MACNTSGIHEGASEWLFHFSKKRARAALNARAYLSSWKVTSYREVDSYLLAVYANKDIIAEADMHMKNFKQSAEPSTVEYGQTLWTKAPCSGPVYDECSLKGTFIEGLR